MCVPLQEIWLFITISFLKMGIAMLQPRYDGYTARSNNGPVKLYNPLSVMRASTRNCISNFWVETGMVIGLTDHMAQSDRSYRTVLPIIAKTLAC